MFATEDKRHEYDFLYSDRDCQFMHKTQDSFSKELKLQHILATFDEEDGGMVVDTSKRKSSELHEPTLPEDLFDDIQCESVHSVARSNDDNENVEEYRENNDISISKQRYEFVTRSALPTGMTKGRIKNDFILKNNFHDKPLLKIFAEKYGDTDALKNAINLFDTNDGLVQTRKKPVINFEDKNPTLPAVMLDSELHLSLIEKSDNEELHPRKGEIFNSDMTVDRTEEEYNAVYSKSVGHNVDQSSTLFRKKTLLTSPVSEYDTSKHVQSEDTSQRFTTKHPRLYENSMNIFETTAIDLDSLVNNFVAAQKINSSCTRRSITHYVNISSEESLDKYKFRKRKGKTKALTIKKKKSYTEKSTKRRGRPRKTTNVVVSSPKITKFNELTNSIKKCNRRTNLAKEQKSTGRCNQEKNEWAVNITSKQHYRNNNTENDFKKQTITKKYNVQITKEDSTLITIPQNTENLSRTNIFEEINIPIEKLKQTDDSKSSSATDYSEDPGFTVEPILDSNFYNDLNEFSITRRQIVKKTSTISFKSLKTFNDKLKHIRELCPEYRQLLITTKKSQENVTLFKVKERHNKYENISDFDLKESSSVEVEHVPIIDFKNPLGIIQHKRRQNQYSWNFKICSWNVNGVRAWVKVRR